jgi:[acyl-carrier-protein] S-malonyltransferase
LEEADDLLGYRLSTIMFEGPQALLTRTQHAQPALFTTSMMVLAVLRAEGGLGSPEVPVGVAAGHSLGEYSALVAAGVLGFGEALKLLSLRGQAMEEAAASQPGTMAALLGLGLEKLSSLPQLPGRVCVLANDNAEGQVVISGHADAVAHTMKWAQDLGARALSLNVGGAFHSPLMASAQTVVAQALESLSFNAPLFPVIPNVSAQPTSQTSQLKEHLSRQITGQVQWRQTMKALDALGVGDLLELGTGAVLTGLARRTIPHLPARSLSTAQALRDFLSLPSSQREPNVHA